MYDLRSFFFPKRMRCLAVVLLAVVDVANAQQPAQQPAQLNFQQFSDSPRPSSAQVDESATDGENLTDSSLAILAALEQATVSAIEKAEHSIVAISRVRRDRQAVAPNDPLKLGSPFAAADSPESPDYIPKFFGSGVIVSPDGFIVTCAHVLDDPQRNDYFVFLDKASYSAEVVGLPAKVLAADPFSDLAVLKIDAENLNAIEFADVKRLRKGQFVIAMGNPEAIARDGQASASWGIISNLQRVAPSDGSSNSVAKETIHEFGTLIQTDAKLSLGTSGGALINLRGEMVGLTTSLVAVSGYEQSAGFAIAVDELFQRAVETLKQGKLPEYGFLGIQPEDLRAYELEQGKIGAKVVVVIPGLPGDQAGLRPEDIIIEVGESPVMNRNELFRELSKAAAGSTIELRVQRFRAGGRVPEVVTLRAELSKKYVSSRRPGYAVNSQAAWRGMDVEYVTAISNELVRSGVLMGRRGAPKLVALAVVPDSAAWKAGLRPGYGILSVDGTAVHSPADFHRAVNARTGRVELSVVQPNGSGQSIVVEGVPK